MELLEADPWANVAGLDTLHIPPSMLLERHFWPLHDQPSSDYDYDYSFVYFDEDSMTRAFAPSAPTAAAADIDGTHEVASDDSAADGGAAPVRLILQFSPRELASLISPLFVFYYASSQSVALTLHSPPPSTCVIHMC